VRRYDTLPTILFTMIDFVSRGPTESKRGPRTTDDMIGACMRRYQQAGRALVAFITEYNDMIV